VKDLFKLIGEVISRGSNSIEELELEIDMPKSFDEKRGWVSTSLLSSEFNKFTDFTNKKEVNKGLLVAEYALSIFTDWNFDHLEYDDSLPQSLKYLAVDGELSVYTLYAHCKSSLLQ
jgi:hypothetical protein